MTSTATEHRSLGARFGGIVAEIDDDLARRIGRLDLPENLRDAIRYTVFGGGKRLRPLLTILSCEAVGGRRDQAHDGAAAVELVHTFSLVHDDLPAMDDDHLRRGQPTLHVHAGEAMAVLTGDAMLSLAFEWVARADQTAATRSLLAGELAQATTGMIAGQVFDTLGGFPAGQTPAQQLHLIHRLKTAVLLRAACRIGAMCGGASEIELDAVTRYSEAVGMMFQIVDDLLDVTQSSEHIGKATGKDSLAGKLTYPGVHGVQATRGRIRQLAADAFEALGPLGESADSLIELSGCMAVRTR